MSLKAIHFDRVLPDLGAASKKQVLHTLCAEAARRLPVNENELLQRLVEKDCQSANSSMGGGVAIPFTRISGLQRPYSILARLENPVPFGSPDGQPVDLVCLVLFPRDETMNHLTALARLSRLLKKKELRRQIMGARDRDFILSVLENAQDQALAA